MMMPMLRGFDVLDNFFDDPFFYPERKGTKFNEVMKTDIRHQRKG